MTQESMIKTGESLVKMIEATRAAGLDISSEFERMHRRCQDDYDHPEWPQYEKIVKAINEIMDGKDPDWRSLYVQ